MNTCCTKIKNIKDDGSEQYYCIVCHTYLHVWYKKIAEDGRCCGNCKYWNKFYSRDERGVCSNQTFATITECHLFFGCNCFELKYKCED